MFLALALAAALSSSNGGAQTPEWRWAVSTGLVHERVIGLLDLPGLVAQPCGPDPLASVPLYAAASRTAATAGSIEYRVTDRRADGSACGDARLVVKNVNGQSSDLPADEGGYEIPAAIVLERSETWFRIALQHGSAWIEREKAEDFHEYPELLTENSSYITKGWNGLLHADPEGPATSVPVSWRAYLDEDIQVDVLEVRRTRDAIWVHVRLMTEVCDGKLDPDPGPASGWILAYRSSGQPSLWFYARGC